MNLPSSRSTLAFLGIGLMGKPMAIRLLRAGYPLAVWNRTRSKAELLAQFGAEISGTPAEAVRQADMSSTRQSEAEAFHAKLKARGVAFIDAPVSGGVLGAEAGSLAIMAGGDASDFARAEPILRVIGGATLVDPAGCGQVAKLCNQLIAGGTLNIIAEALLVAQAAAADPAAVRTAIRGGFAESRLLEVHGQRKSRARQRIWKMC